MRELAALEVTTVALEPNCEQTLILRQPYSHSVLLSHFEVKELSPVFSDVELTDLRIEKTCYLLAPVPLSLVHQWQGDRRRHLEQERQEQLQHLLGSMPPHMLQQFKPSRHETRLVTLDIHWKPGTLLALTFKNSGSTAVDKVSLEIMPYAFDTPLPVTN